MSNGWGRRLHKKTRIKGRRLSGLGGRGLEVDKGVLSIVIQEGVGAGDLVERFLEGK